MILRIAEEALFDTSTLVFFRKHISVVILMELNEYLFANKDDSNNDNVPPSLVDPDDNDVPKEDKNEGTITLDATCAPASIHYPQDVSLLNEAREKLETIIYRFYKSYGLPLPRRYGETCQEKS